MKNRQQAIKNQRTDQQATSSFISHCLLVIACFSLLLVAVPAFAQERREPESKAEREKRRIEAKKKRDERRRVDKRTDPAIPLAPGKKPVTPRPGSVPAKRPPFPVSTTKPLLGPTQPQKPPSGGLTPPTDDYPKNIKHSPKFPANEPFSFDLPQEDLSAVVKWISDLTGKNFILTDKVKGRKISIFSPRKVRIGEAWKAFLSALEVNGLTLVASGNYLKLVEQRDANQMPIANIPEKDPVPDDDRFVTRLIPVKYVDLNEIQNVVNKLKGRGADLTPYPPTNILILSDTSANIRRILKIIQKLDIPTGTKERIFIRKIKHATASDISTKVNELFGDKAGKKPRGQPTTAAPPAPPHGAPPPPIPPTTPTSSPSAAPDSDEEIRVTKTLHDERTNQLIVVTNDRAYRRVVALIKLLDIPLPGGEGRVRIHYLENAEAEEVANVLASLATGGRKSTGPRPAAVAGQPRAPASTADLFEGEIKITADKSTNSLIIVGTNKDYASLKDIIKKLDIQRHQVFVEAVIMEVAIDRQRKQKVSLLAGKNFGDSANPVPFLYGLNPADTLIVNPTALTGFGAILRGPDIPGTTGLLAGLAGGAAGATAGGIGIGAGGITLGTGLPSFGAFLQFLQSNSDTNVLSTPHILATDNKEAEISVGEKVPFISAGTTSLAGALGGIGGGLLSTSVTREDVALKLSIKPRINESSYVTMDVNNEISEVGAIEPTSGQRRTTKRTVKTTVIVKDGNTVVIGGLMKNSVTEGVQKIPILGDIPVLGFFFRKKEDEKSKSNLLIFLTPHIIKSPQDFRRIFDKKMRERQEFLDKFLKAGFDNPFTIDYGKKHGPLEEVNQHGGKFEEMVSDNEKVEQENKEAEERRTELRSGKKKKKSGAPLPKGIPGVKLEKKGEKAGAPDTPKVGGDDKATKGASGDLRIEPTSDVVVDEGEDEE